MSSGGQASDHWKRRAEAAKQHGRSYPQQQDLQNSEDQWQRDRYDKHSNGPKSRSSRGGNSRVQQTREQGYIRTLKESFGFLSCVERADDLFFHYDEVRGYHIEELRVGLEVDFVLKVGKDGRQFASGVQVLPAGTIQLDQIEDESMFKGIVTRGYKRPRYNKGDQPPSVVFSGRIHPLPNEYTSTDVSRIYTGFINSKSKTTNVGEDSPLIAFGMRGLEVKGQDDEKKSRSNPRIGDIVSFVIGKERSSSFKHALRVEKLVDSAEFLQEQVKQQLLEQPELPRIRGVVTELNNDELGGPIGQSRGAQASGRGPKSTIHGGVIQCADPTAGDVVFRVEDLPEKHRPVAETGDQRNSGMAKGNWRSSPSTKTGGSKSTGTQDWRVENEGPTTVRVNMALEFQLVKDPRNLERKLAANITVLPPGSVKLEEVVAVGVPGVVLTKHGEGGVISVPRDLLVPEEGTGSQKEEEIKTAEQGEKKVEALAQGEDKSKSPQPNAKDAGGQNKNSQQIIKDPEQGENPSVVVTSIRDGLEQVKFTASDVVTPGPKPNKGDSVRCDVVKSHVTGLLRAVRVYLSYPIEEEVRIKQITSGDEPFVSCIGRIGRETGEVTTLRDTFGFIRCADREGDIFFPYNEVVASPLTKAAAKGEVNPSKLFYLQQKPPLAINDVVSFTVVESGGGQNSQGGHQKKLAANRVLVVPKKRGQREVVLQRNVSGVVLGNVSEDSSGLNAGRVQYLATKFVSPYVFEKLREFKECCAPFEKCEALDIKPIKSGKGIVKTLIPRKKPLVKDGRASLQILPREQELARQYGKMLGLVEHAEDVESKQSALRFVRQTTGSELAEESGVAETNSTETEQGLAESDVVRPPTEQISLKLKTGELESRAKANDTGSGSESTSIHNNENNKVEGTIADIPFTKSSFASDAARVKPGENVTFDVVVDQPTMRLFCKNLRNAKAMEQGVVACVRDQGFGFIQGITNNERVFFRESAEITFKPGDQVAYSVTKSNRNPKAVGIQLVPETEHILPDIAKDDERVVGFVVSEPKQLQSQISTFKSDCSEAVLVAASQLSQSSMGKLVIANTFKEASPVQEEVDWRREGELRSRVRSAAKTMEDAKAVMIEANSAAESKVVKQFARKESLFVRDGPDPSAFSVIVASSKTAAQELVEEMIKADKSLAQKSPREQARTKALPSYWFTAKDIEEEGAEDTWVPLIGDQVEFQIGSNRATGQARALHLKLVKGIGTKQQGVIDRAPHPNGGRYGFVRPHVAGQGTQAIFGTVDKVDEAFKPGSGGRDGSVKFDANDVVGGTKFNDGDEVEYLLLVDPRTKVPRATRVKLLKKNPNIPKEKEVQTGKPERKVVNKVLQQATINMVIPRFVQAKGPDGTNGFDLGRGRNRVPKIVRERAAQAKLRPDAKEFTPPGAARQ